MSSDAPVLVLDVESASGVDVKVGASAYWQHPSTIVHCLCAGIFRGPDDYERYDWTPGDPVPAPVQAHTEAGLPVVAHNVGFERAAFEHVLTPVYGWAAINDDQWIDTAARGLSYALPPTLEGLAAALGCPVQKDTEGAAVMKRMAKATPREDGTWEYDRDPVRLARLVAYCWIDVLATAQVFYKLPAMHPFESLVWRVDQRINQRGVAVDQRFARNVTALAQRRKVQLEDEVARVTGDALGGVMSLPALKTWVKSHGVALETVRKRNAKGEPLVTEKLDKNAIAELLAKPDLPDVVRKVLQLRAESGRLTSLAKMRRVPEMVSADGRLRGALRYHGAHTGRWASSGVQLHNLPKCGLDDTVLDVVHEGVATRDLMLIELFAGDPLAAMSQSLRGVLVPGERKDLIGADYSAIEARVVAWLAGQDDILQVFRRGEDVYVYAAKRIGSDSRQLGKVVTLALGYGMGDVKFAATAGQWGTPLELLDAKRIKNLWRESNDRIVQFWYELEDAFRKAILHPGETFRVGRLVLHNNRHFLRIVLPSGRSLHYFRPHTKRTVKKIQVVDENGEIVTREMDVDEIRFYSVGPDKKSMRRDSTYGGKLAENCTQAVARDLLAAALVRLDATAYDVVVHVHDSAAAEVPEGTGSVEEFVRVLEDSPAWAAGMPVAAEGYRAKRFRG